MLRAKSNIQKRRNTRVGTFNRNIYRKQGLLKQAWVVTKVIFFGQDVKEMATAQYAQAHDYFELRRKNKERLEEDMKLRKWQSTT